MLIEVWRIKEWSSLMQFINPLKIKPSPINDQDTRETCCFFLWAYKKEEKDSSDHINACPHQFLLQNLLVPTLQISLSLFLSFFLYTWIFFISFFLQKRPLKIRFNNFNNPKSSLSLKRNKPIYSLFSIFKSSVFYSIFFLFLNHYSNQIHN